MARSRGGISYAINEDEERLLRETTITADHPGPILRDFQTLLDFIGTAGVQAGGPHHLLPINILTTLNRHMNWPLDIDLDRPQLRSYPNLQGLHLLSRASGLVIVQGAGAKAKLVVDAPLLQRWTKLNPTEQYFSLLDAWLVRARKEMVGGRRGLNDAMIDYAADVWTWIPDQGLHYSVKDRKSINAVIVADPDRYTIALMALFGFLDIEQAKAIPGHPWIPASVRRRPFGQAMVAALSPKTRIYATLQYYAEALAGKSKSAPKKSNSPSAAAVNESAAPPDACDDGIFRFNSFHSIFARYFPSLQDSLAVDLGEATDGLFIFRVSLRGSMWRRIAAPAQSTLENLADAIRASVDFDDDHLWSFRFKDRFGAKAEIKHPAASIDTEGSEMYADEVEVGQLTIAPGESMVFLYDYGDNWEFTVLLEKVDPPAPRQKKPKLIEKHGPSPEQYPDWNDDE